MIKLSTIKPNPNNPRLVKDDKFFKLTIWENLKKETRTEKVEK